MSWFVMALKKYATFSRRARRKEYWMFFLWAALIVLGLAIIDNLVGTYDEATGWGLLSGLFSLAMVVPSISVTARRLHDIGKSGWLQLLFLIPLVGFILWIIWMVTDGDSHTNQYGPSVKGGFGYDTRQAAV
ncbi:MULTISPECIES: DUF805 domain-containing protein [Nocardioides]|uniref:DUF805 domain-containing protein n=1 Tax=Nocardioides vastitatis TaxID=2568655 RepID=A0ABW0ZDF5_9ACTN|nr:DUF805 domain-containing protein [Nocardioides sp.]THI96169.1 DUF805 domain-containing protein [Nocardioides sp.]